MGMRCQLEITLKSELCSGAGTAFGRVIDADLEYDANGIPVIPGKRIKGCLRDAAELIGVDETLKKKLFGEGGSDRTPALMVGNAYPSGYDTLHSPMDGTNCNLAEDMKNLMQDAAFGKYIQPQRVLECFTTERAQTRIGENGVALDDTLRVTRTLNPNFPYGDKGELQMLADIMIDTGDDDWNDKLLKELVWIAKAVRNIGMDRNRGLGSVRCKIGELSDSQQERLEKADIWKLPEMQPEKEYTLRYTITNDAALMLSSIHDSKTERYISGRRMIGFFAKQYLAVKSDMTEFEDIFLKGGVKFGPLYPVVEIQEGEEKASLICCPAPSYICKMKKSGKLVDVSQMPGKTSEQSENWEYNAKDGNQPKGLSGKFIGQSANGKVALYEVRTQIDAHHRHATEKGDDSKLFAFESICPGQFFAGTITGKGAYLSLFIKILKNSAIRLGKSLSAEYGTCHVVKIAVEEVPSEEKFFCEKNRQLRVVLRSDAVFVNGTGYTIDEATVKKLIAEQLEIAYDEDAVTYDSVEVGELVGYYGKWNLKRSAVPGIKAGSVFTYHLTENRDINLQKRVGENTAEGFGLISVEAAAAVNQANEALPAYAYEQCRAAENVLNLDELSAEAAELAKQILMKASEEIIWQKAVREGRSINEKVLDTSAALLGRITLMLKECQRDGSQGELLYQAFCERIRSIADKDKRDEYKVFLMDHINAKGIEKEQKSNYVFYKEQAALVGELAEIQTLYNKLASDEQEYTQKLDVLWDQYLYHILTGVKYQLRQKKQAESGKKGGK